jgi:hypothetical protein
MSRRPALGELLDLLRAEGFAVGVDDHVRVGKLLALETAWSEDQLRIALRSVLVKDAQERAAFDAVWTRLFVPRQSNVSRDPLFPVALGPPPRPPLARRLRLGALAVLGAGLIAAAIAAWPWRSGEAVAPDAGIASGASGLMARPDAPAAPDAPVAPDAPAAPVADASVSAVVPGSASDAPRDERRIEAVEASGPWRELVSWGMLFVGGALLVGGLALGDVRARQRKRFVPGPWRYSLRVPKVTRPVLDGDDIVDGAAHLTWQAAPEVAGDLDGERSAHATVAAGGAPVILYRPPPAAPRYVVLEDTAVGSERWRFLYDELLRGLAREGVDLTRYTFMGDPSSCTSYDGRETCELRDLVEHCDALIVIGDGDAAFDPLEGSPAEWLDVLQRAPRRLWLNPVPEARWSRGAQIIARGTPMEHAVARGLAALQRTSAGRRPDAPAFPRVIERAPATSVGFAALRDHVGPAGLRAIAAVAVAGSPSIAALRWLNEHFRLRLDESTWLCVTTLPWFRSGAWPEGLQARLVEWLQANDVMFADAVAVAAATLLVADEPPAGSAAHLRWELDLAAIRMRVGDRVGASAAIRNVGATALHREVARRIPGASSDRVDRRIRVSAVLGAVLCMVAGLYLGLSDSSPVVYPANSSPLVFGDTDDDTSNTHDIKVQYTIIPPDPKNPETRGDAPRIEVRVIGAPNLTANKFVLVDKSVRPPFEMKASSRRGFLQGSETLAVAIVMLGWEPWIGNTSYRDESDKTRVGGVLAPLQAALDRLNFKDAGPPGSVGMVITYSEEANIKLPMGPIERLSGGALGTEKDYIGTTGFELVKGIELALAELRKVSKQRKVLIIITDGNDSSSPEAAKAKLQMLKQQANGDQVQVEAIVYRAAESGPNNVVLGVFSTSTVSIVDNIAVTVNAILQRMANRQYLTFPGFNKETKLGFSWDGKPHELVLKIDKDESEPVTVPLAPIWKPDEGGSPRLLILVLLGVLLLIIISVAVKLFLRATPPLPLPLPLPLSIPRTDASRGGLGAQDRERWDTDER